MPGVAVPGVAVPGVAVPGVAVPGVAVPGVAVPGVALPGPAGRSVRAPASRAGAGTRPQSIRMCRSARIDALGPDASAPQDNHTATNSRLPGRVPTDDRPGTVADTATTPGSHLRSRSSTLVEHAFDFKDAGRAGCQARRVVVAFAPGGGSRSVRVAGQVCSGQRSELARRRARVLVRWRPARWRAGTPPALRTRGRVSSADHRARSVTGDSRATTVRPRADPPGPVPPAGRTPCPQPPPCSARRSGRTSPPPGCRTAR